MLSKKERIGWSLIILLFISYVTINSVIFFKKNQRGGESSDIKLLMKSTDELKMLIEVNQSRLEKRMFELKRSLQTQCEQSDGSLRYKNLAKLLLLVVKMKNSLLQEAKFDNHINVIKPLILELEDPEMETTVNELESLSLKEVSTLHELKLSFEKTIDSIDYNQSTFFKRIISNWIKVKDKNNPLRVKLAEIEESINDNDWQDIASIINNLTHPQLKPWLSRLNSFIVALKNVSIIYNHLLQYVS